MIQITDKTLCSGCEACAQICPTRCISMVDDHEGFAYPVADAGRCIECGLCERVCPFLSGSAVNQPKKWIAAVNSDPDEVRESSSGGIFSVLAGETLHNDGAICGAAFSSDFSAVSHQWATKTEDVKRLMGSKYVQSRVGESFIEVREKLKAGQQVLFVGTPCQTAGLKNFLQGKSHPGLLLVDLLCHGVPSPLVWKRYLSDRVDSLLADNPGLSHTCVDAVSFRDKRNGWENYSVTVGICGRDQDGEDIHAESSVPNSADVYIQGFLSNLYLRPACYECPFRGQSYAGDLTLGDCWGIGKISPSADSKQGISLVMVNTEKGESHLSGLEILRHFGGDEVETLRRSNGGLVRVIGVNSQRRAFFDKLNGAKSVSKLIAQCLSPSLLQRLKGAILNRLLGPFTK